MPSERVWTYGKDQEPPRRAALRAGPLSLELEGAELVGLRLGDREAVRRIYSAVRDRNWGTVPGVLTNLHQEIGEEAFRISFDADHREREIHFSWKGVVTGDRDGTVTYSMEGLAHTTFLRNRIGFCILHPDAAAGARCRIVHAGGPPEESRLPEAISPHQPFKDLRAFAHEVAPGQWAELTFEGDVFEMEDQRNWTDASFKTYCTPVHIPFPAEVTAGTPVAQSVTLHVPGARRAGSVAAAPPTYTIGAARRPLPPIGLGMASHGLPLSAREVGRLRAVRPAHLRVDLTPGEPGWEDALRRAGADAGALGAALEIAVVVSDAARDELLTVAAAARALPCAVARWLVFHARESATSERWVAVAREVLQPGGPGVPVAAGAKAYFTELSRGPRPTFADQVVFSVNPQIHAFDDASLVETLRMQRLAVENAARLSGGKPIAVSPVTLRPRFNAVATGPVPPPAPGQLPDQVDPRQMSLFGAAWTLGSLANLAGAAASLTYYETTGWRGLVEIPAGPPVPERFHSLPGCPFPLYHVLADVGAFQGGNAVAGDSSAPLRLEGLTLEARGKRRTVAANLTDRPLAARIIFTAPRSGDGAPGRGWMRTLDRRNVERACCDPEGFRAELGQLVAAHGGELAIELEPYATVRIDWE